MNTTRSPDMMGALRLTRSGKLKEAVRLLRGGRPLAPAALPQVPEAVAGLVAKLGGAVRALEDVFAPPDARPAAPPDAQPGGGRFMTRHYANAAGSRDYKLFVPSNYRGQPMPLVVMLHGCTQSPDDFAAGTRMNELAEAQNFLVAYPAQDRRANATKCWNWFNTADQKRDQGEPSLIAGITRQVMTDFSVRKNQVYIAGLSAGGATAAIMGAAYPELYAAIGVHSGLACGAADSMVSAFHAMKQGATVHKTIDGTTIPAIVFHGDRDHTVNVANADQVIAQAKANAKLTAKVTQGTSAGGETYTRTEQTDSRGKPVLEQWVLHGAGHAWSGGSTAGTFTDPKGPDASREIVRFFFAHTL